MHRGVIEGPSHLVHRLLCLGIVDVIEGCNDVDGGGIFIIDVVYATMFINDVL